MSGSSCHETYLHRDSNSKGAKRTDKIHLRISNTFVAPQVIWRSSAALAEMDEVLPKNPQLLKFSSPRVPASTLDSTSWARVCFCQSAALWRDPGANRWFLKSTPIQMPPQSGGICGRMTEDLPLGCLRGGLLTWPRGGARTPKVQVSRIRL